MTLSVGLLAYNSEKWIEESARSMWSQSDQIIVGVDDKTTDNTRFILDRMGIPHYEFTWTHSYAAAKNTLLDHLTGDWAMILDDDEKLDGNAAERLKHLIEMCNLEGYDGIQLGMKQHFPDWTTDEEVKSEENPDGYMPEFYPNTHMQIFRRKPEYRFGSIVHEGIIGIHPDKIYPFERTEALGIFIHHHAWKGDRAKFEAPKHFYYKDLSEGKTFEPGEHKW